VVLLWLTLVSTSTTTVTRLTAATTAAIDSLSGKGWQVYINGELVIPNILDLEPAAAYSLRSFDADADPNVVNVRRSSDNATSDFTASEVSDGTLVAFVGAGNDGHVTTWYDQGGTNHATQATASSQPKIVDGGTLVTEGGLPALDINKTPFDLNSTISFNDLSWFTVTKKADSGPQDSIIFDGGSGSYYGGDDVDSGGNPMLLVGAQSIHKTKGNTSNSGGEENLHLSYYNRNGSNASGGLNGEIKTEATGATATFVLSRVFKYSADSVAYDYVGKAQEIVLFNTDQSANRTGIEANINDHFDIYS
jgi:hypothetical protein